MKRRFIPTLDNKFIARSMIESLHQNKDLTWIATTLAHRTHPIDEVYAAYLLGGKDEAKTAEFERAERSRAEPPR